jgi:hypothetical protein
MICIPGLGCRKIPLDWYTDDESIDDILKRDAKLKKEFKSAADKVKAIVNRPMYKNQPYLNNKKKKSKKKKKKRQKKKTNKNNKNNKNIKGGRIRKYTYKRY